jgi:hypothetical protein
MVAAVTDANTAFFMIRTLSSFSLKFKTGSQAIVPRWHPSQKGCREI